LVYGFLFLAGQEPNVARPGEIHEKVAISQGRQGTTLHQEEEAFAVVACVVYLPRYDVFTENHTTATLHAPVK
jgi:hypothetical protein